MRVILGGASLLGLVVAAWLSIQHPASSDVGQPPLRALRRVDGTPAGLQDVPGRPMVINLWASWCAPCLREMPLLAEFAAQRGDVEVLFVNSGETPAKVQAYLAREKLGPIRVLLDPELQIARHYGGKGLPITLFLRPDGRLSVMVTGEITRGLLERNATLIASPRAAP